MCMLCGLKRQHFLRGIVAHLDEETGLMLYEIVDRLLEFVKDAMPLHRRYVREELTLNVLAGALATFLYNTVEPEAWENVIDLLRNQIRTMLYANLEANSIRDEGPSASS